ncbi:hypothetical protein SESBI_33428 [Sesbania bispinosa]|nr:hypothetical protein SESBI_33428 [Sesbania bispinosa]
MRYLKVLPRKQPVAALPLWVLDHPAAQVAQVVALYVIGQMQWAGFALASVKLYGQRCPPNREHYSSGQPCSFPCPDTVVRCLRKCVRTPLSGQQSVSVNQISLPPATFNLPFAQKHNNERLQKYLLMIKASNQQPPSSSFNSGIPCGVGTESSRVRE